MLTCGFFNSVSGDRAYNAEQMAYIINALVKDGVMQNYGEFFATKPSDGMSVVVEKGMAWFDSTWTRNDGQIVLNIEPADVSMSRYDAVVLEVDRSVGVRANSIKVVKGTISNSPKKPTMVKTDNVKQYPLAYIKVDPGVSEISSSAIEIRVGQSDCPWITGILSTIDINVLFDKWNGEFTDWFDNLKKMLDDNVVTNLQNQIDELGRRVEEIGKESKEQSSKIGDILETYRPNPDKFLLCDGSKISTTKYNKLYELIGYKYGMASTQQYFSGYINNTNVNSLLKKERYLTWWVQDGYHAKIIVRGTDSSNKLRVIDGLGTITETAGQSRVSSFIIVDDMLYAIIQSGKRTATYSCSVDLISIDLSNESSSKTVIRQLYSGTTTWPNQVTAIHMFYKDGVIYFVIRDSSTSSNYTTWSYNISNNAIISNISSYSKQYVAGFISDYFIVYDGQSSSYILSRMNAELVFNADGTVDGKPSNLPSSYDKTCAVCTVSSSIITAYIFYISDNVLRNNKKTVTIPVAYNNNFQYNSKAINDTDILVSILYYSTTKSTFEYGYLYYRDGSLSYSAIGSRSTTDWDTDIYSVTLNINNTICAAYYMYSESGSIYMIMPDTSYFTLPKLTEKDRPVYVKAEE